MNARITRGVRVIGGIPCPSNRGDRVPQPEEVDVKVATFRVFRPGSPERPSELLAELGPFRWGAVLVTKGTEQPHDVRHQVVVASRQKSQRMKDRREHT